MATIRTATATHPGTQPLNADAAVVYTLADTGITAAAVIDGIGTTPEAVRLAEVAAEVATRVGTRRGALPGLLAAGALATNQAVPIIREDAVGVLAVWRPDDITVVTHVGDCRCYSWTGEELVQHTVDHTIGQQLRLAGASEFEAAENDHRVRTTLGRAVVGLVDQVEITDRLIVLTSDGVHQVLGNEAIADLVVRHQRAPEALATALVDAAVAVESPGAERDNASAVVLLITPS